MERINIAMTTDEHYILQTKVAFSSLVRNGNKHQKYTLYILCAEDLDRENRADLSDLENIFFNVKVEFVEIVDKDLSGAVTTAHIPISSYYRLFMATYILEERCLFLDGDMIVSGPLDEIYFADIDNFYAAAVPDMGIKQNADLYKDYAQRLGIKSMDNYVNAGFMLFNLRKIREDKLTDKLVKEIKHGYKYMDQDILNKVFEGKILTLPIIYDFFMEYINEKIEKNLLSGKSETEIKEHIVVRHFTGTFKPWLNIRLATNEIWWTEAKQIMSEGNYCQYREKAEVFQHVHDISSIVDKLSNNIVIWGYSSIGTKIADYILKKRIDVELLFADNNLDVQQEMYREIPVCSSEVLIKSGIEYDYLISSQNGYVQIYKQLLKSGVKESRIFRFINKDSTYYSRLSQEYTDYENKMRI